MAHSMTWQLERPGGRWRVGCACGWAGGPFDAESATWHARQHLADAALDADPVAQALSTPEARVALGDELARHELWLAHQRRRKPLGMSPVLLALCIFGLVALAIVARVCWHVGGAR